MNGKGDRWRGGWSRLYKNNYDSIFKKEKQMILRSGNVNVVNVPHKYWKEAGWKLNDKVEVECTEDVIIIRRKK
tara:strand:+ start:296 stop:517 length:222 start_codon:yes stop_codon:yes gene_type:complete